MMPGCANILMYPGKITVLVALDKYIRYTDTQHRLNTMDYEVTI